MAYFFRVCYPEPVNHWLTRSLILVLCKRQIINMLKMNNAVQNYAWGSTDALTQLYGIPNPQGMPMAELWMGAHPKSSSQVLDANGQWHSLRDVMIKIQITRWGVIFSSALVNCHSCSKYFVQLNLYRFRFTRAKRQQRSVLLKKTRQVSHWMRLSAIIKMRTISLSWFMPSPLFRQ